MPLTEITSALGALRGTVEFLKTVHDAEKQVDLNVVTLELQEKLINLHSEIFAIQEKYEALAATIVQLETELKREQERNEENSKYELESVGPGQFAYKFVGQDRPEHFICSHCFEDGKKSILEVQKSDRGTLYLCRRNDRHLIDVHH